MPKGKKICPSCNAEHGVRTKVCGCGQHFQFKPAIFKRNKGKKVDWKTLKKGDVIRCVNGHGPYWINKDTGEKVGFNYRGKYRVMGVEENGICAWPYMNKTESGYSFIYMGEPSYSEDLNLHREPHKVVLLELKER